MNERLRQVRKYLKLSQEEFGRRLGVTGAGISRLESGERNITEQMLLAVCREFNISEEWLRNGNGKMITDSNDNAITLLAKELNLDDYAIRALKAYEKLDSQSKKTIHQYILFLASSSQNEDS